MNLETFVMSAFAVWRLTHMIVSERGAFDIFTRLRSIRWLSEGANCFWCASVWSASAVLLFASISETRWIVVLLALSALAILMKGLFDDL